MGSIQILGAEGMLGTAWRRFFDQEKIGYTAYSRSQLDITDEDQVRKLAYSRSQLDEDQVGKRTADLVINCAAFTNVDLAESEAVSAYSINTKGPRILAQHCNTYDIKLVHFSSDYIFDGSSDNAYKIDSKACPISTYGITKLLGEHEIMAHNSRALIIRASLLHAPWGQNFVKTMSHLLRTKAEINVVADQRSNPTCCLNLVENSVHLFEQSGIWHLTDSGSCSKYEFVKELVKIIGSNSNIVPCSAGDFGLPARRPKNSSLDLSLTTNQIGELPSWTEGLKRTIMEK